MAENKKVKDSKKPDYKHNIVNNTNQYCNTVKYCNYCNNEVNKPKLLSCSCTKIPEILSNTEVLPDKQEMHIADGQYKILDTTCKINDLENFSTDNVIHNAMAEPNEKIANFLISF